MTRQEMIHDLNEDGLNLIDFVASEEWNEEAKGDLIDEALRKFAIADELENIDIFRSGKRQTTNEGTTDD